MKKSSALLTRIAILSGLALGAFAFSAVAGSWTAAPPNPPNNNADAPINVGGGGPVGTASNYAQSKSGLLALASLMFDPGGATNIPVGSVLTAVDNYGTVGWGATGSGGSCLKWKSGQVSFAGENSKPVVFSASFSALPIIKLYYDFAVGNPASPNPPNSFSDQPDDNNHGIVGNIGIAWSANVASTGFTIENPYNRSGHVSWIAFDGSSCN
jgi:hypothetical protein